MKRFRFRVNAVRESAGSDGQRMRTLEADYISDDNQQLPISLCPYEAFKIEDPEGQIGDEVVVTIERRRP